MSELKKLLLSSIMLVFMSTVAWADGSKDGGDIWPWPWGSECPFPWNSIEGSWKIKDKENAGYFKFKIKSELNDGSHIVEITHLDFAMRVTAIGSGFAPIGQKIVRAALHTTTNSQTQSYWVIVRAYQSDKQIGCNGGMRTLVTIRPVVGDQSWDLTYEIDKLMYGPIGYNTP